jgi:hypothetical protein
MGRQGAPTGFASMTGEETGSHGATIFLGAEQDLFHNAKDLFHDLLCTERDRVRNSEGHQDRCSFVATWVAFFEMVCFEATVFDANQLAAPFFTTALGVAGALEATSPFATTPLARGTLATFLSLLASEADLVLALTDRRVFVALASGSTGCGFSIDFCACVLKREKTPILSTKWKRRDDESRT